MPISSIVVGVDGSPASREALRWSLKAAQRFRVGVKAVTTWSYPWIAAAPAPVGMPVPPADSMEQAATEIQAAMLAEFDAGDVPVTSSIACGEAAATLLAESADGGLLVVGSRGHGAFRGALLGSVSSRCVSHAEVPVLVVPADARGKDGPARIVVGVDGSEDAAEALMWALAWARPGVDTVEAVHVMNFPDATDVAAALDRAEREAGIARGRLTTTMEPAEVFADENGVGLSMQFVPGDPRDVLHERGFAADLLVVGGRGHGPIASMLLGSVASHLVHHLDGPLVVVPGTRRGRSGGD